MGTNRGELVEDEVSNTFELNLVRPLEGEEVRISVEDGLRGEVRRGKEGGGRKNRFRNEGIFPMIGQAPRNQAPGSSMGKSIWRLG